MPQFQKLSTEDREIGKALAERAKLDPSIVLEDFTVQSRGDVVAIRFEVLHQMPRVEFEALVASIRTRAATVKPTLNVETYDGTTIDAHVTITEPTP